MESIQLPIETVVLVLTLVAGVKRHIPSIKGWKTVLVALLAAILLSYDYTLPAWAAPIQTGLKVFAVTVGGHAYLSKLAEKFGMKLPPILSTLLQTGDDPPTKAEEKPSDTKTLPPAAPPPDDDDAGDPKAPK